MCVKVCLDYWNSLVLELYEAHNNLDNPAATANMMGLQVIQILALYFAALLYGDSFLKDRKVDLVFDLNPIPPFVFLY